MGHWGSVSIWLKTTSGCSLLMNVAALSAAILLVFFSAVFSDPEALRAIASSASQQELPDVSAWEVEAPVRAGSSRRRSAPPAPPWCCPVMPGDAVIAQVISILRGAG